MLVKHFFHLNSKYEVFVSDKKLLTSRFICVLTLETPIDEKTIDAFIASMQYSVDCCLKQINDNAQNLINNFPPNESSN